MRGCRAFGECSRVGGIAHPCRFGSPARGLPGAVDEGTVSPSWTDGGGFRCPGYTLASTAEIAALGKRRSLRSTPRLKPWDSCPDCPPTPASEKRLPPHRLAMRSTPARAARDRCRATCYIEGMNHSHGTPNSLAEVRENTPGVRAAFVLRAVRPLHDLEEWPASKPTPALLLAS